VGDGKLIEEECIGEDIVLVDERPVVGWLIAIERTNRTQQVEVWLPDMLFALRSVIIVLKLCAYFRREQESVRQNDSIQNKYYSLQMTRTWDVLLTNLRIMVSFLSDLSIGSELQAAGSPSVVWVNYPGWTYYGPNWQSSYFIKAYTSSLAYLWRIRSHFNWGTTVLVTLFPRHSFILDLSLICDCRNATGCGSRPAHNTELRWRDNRTHGIVAQCRPRCYHDTSTQYCII